MPMQWGPDGTWLRRLFFWHFTDNDRTCVGGGGVLKVRVCVLDLCNMTEWMPPRSAAFDTTARRMGCHGDERRRWHDDEACDNNNNNTLFPLYEGANYIFFSSVFSSVFPSVFSVVDINNQAFSIKSYLGFNLSDAWVAWGSSVGCAGVLHVCVCFMQCKVWPCFWRVDWSID